MIGIDEDADPVRGRIAVATHQILDDFVRLAVVRAHVHVQRGRVVRDAELGGLGGFRAFTRLPLHEIAHQRRPAPDVFAERPARGRAPYVYRFHTRGIPVRRAGRNGGRQREKSGDNQVRRANHVLR